MRGVKGPFKGLRQPCRRLIAVPKTDGSDRKRKLEGETEKGENEEFRGVKKNI